MSRQCGTCWSIQYGGKTILATAVDHAANGVVLSEAALNELTGGNAVQFGTVDAVVTKVDGSQCGLKSGV